MRVSHSAPASDEGGPVALVLRGPEGVAAHADAVDDPRTERAGSAGTTRSQQRVMLWAKFGLDKQVGEGRMRLVGGGRGQHHLAVARHFQFTRRGGVVGQRDPAQLGVVLGRNHDLHPRINPGYPLAELGLVESVGHLIVLSLVTGWLVSGRPDGVAPHITDVDEAPPVVAGDIGAPTGNGQAVKETAAAASGGEHHAIAPV